MSTSFQAFFKSFFLKVRKNSHGYRKHGNKVSKNFNEPSAVLIFFIQIIKFERFFITETLNIQWRNFIGVAFTEILQGDKSESPTINMENLFASNSFTRANSQLPIGAKSLQKAAASLNFWKYWFSWINWRQPCANEPVTTLLTFIRRNKSF